MRLLSGLLLLFTALSANAQYNGPAVEACRKYAIQEGTRGGVPAQEVMFERDANLLVERYTRKLGSQFVSSILTGNGAVALDGAPSAELAFICLLANDRTPVFFNWLPRANASAFTQCTRHPSVRGRLRSCLETLLRVTEADLGVVYAESFQEANAKGGAPLAAYRKANDEWREYRDAECARRRDLAPQGIDPADFQLACTIDLSRRRALDMR